MLPRSLLLLALPGAAACSSGSPASVQPDRAPVAWVERFGDTASQQASGVAMDPSGDVVLTGSFHGVMQLGSHALTAQPAGSLFVAKLDAHGHPLWGSTWSTASSSEGHAIVADRDGNVLMVGRQGAAAASSTAPADGFFVAKLDPAGSMLWTTPLQSAYERFNLTVSGGGYAMLSAGTPGGLYVEMVDPTGYTCWSLTFPIACARGMNGIATNSGASLAITGFYDCPVDLGGGALVADGRDSFFVATYDSQGDYLWSRGIGAPGGDAQGRSLAMDDAGDVFVAGNYTGSPDLGGGVLPESTGGLFVVKFDPAGHHAWSHGYDGATPAAGQSVVLGPAGQVFVMASGIVPGSAGYSAEPQGAFVLALTAAGDDGGVNRFTPQGAKSSFAGAGIAVGAGGQVAFTGSLSGSVTFDGASLASAGSLDVVAGVIGN